MRISRLVAPDLLRRPAQPLHGFLALSVVLLAGTRATAQQPLVENGQFELRGPDGFAQGWERLQLTADCTVELGEPEPGALAVRITGTSRLSRGGLRAPLKPLAGASVLRVMVRYQGRQGRRSIVVRPQGADPQDTKTGDRLVLPPSPLIRPGGGLLTLKTMAAVESLEILLLHEGPGETWFDDLEVSLPAEGGQPGQPPLGPSAPRQPVAEGPYATRASPSDGATVRVNPPRFCWPGRPGGVYTLEWSSSPQFAPDTTRKIEGLTLNLYIPSETLAPGQWFWRVTETGGAETGMPADIFGDEDAEAAPEEAYEEGVPMDEEAEPVDEEAPAEPAPDPPPDEPLPKAAQPILLLAPLLGQEPPPEEPPVAPEPKQPRKGKREKPKPEEAAPEEPMPEEGIPAYQEESAEPRPEAPFGPMAAPSTVRSFRLDDSAVSVPVPSVATVVAALAAHPRVWVTLDGVVGLRGAIAGPLKAEWEALRARLDAAKGGELTPEPKGKGKWRSPSPKDLENNDAILLAATTEAGLVRDFAFAALLSGEQAYADEAKRRALHLAAWDVKGSTGYVSHDQAFREILLSLALTVDWLPQAYTDEEKPKVVAAITARGEALHEALSGGVRPINLFPYSSHGQTALGFLTVVSLATVGDVPEAETWLQFALPTAVALFSPWAGEDGGWLQGETYWKRSAPFTFQLFDALTTAAGIDLYQLPWAAATTNYKTYMHPPYRTQGGFGDGPEMPPDADDRAAMRRLAAARQDGTAAWYAAGIATPEPPTTAFDVLWRDPAVQPQAPAGPPSAAFPDSGLFALHSTLTDPAGVHLYGRASRFGSFNHAHADQGHFTLEAFGAPLLIDAGYFDWYRSPHATSFSRTSLAHNVLLVNGKIGQRLNDITARGTLEGFLHTQAVDTVRVQAAEAYPPQVLEAYERRFVYLRPDRLVVFDHVKPTEKATYTWLLHSLGEPALDAAASTALIRQGPGALVVGAYGPEKLAWTTTKAFAKNPRFTEADVEAPAQWHTSIKSARSTDSEDLILLLAPFQGEIAPTVQALSVTDGRGAEAVTGDRRTVALVRHWTPPPPPKPPKAPRQPKKPAKPVQPPAEPGAEQPPAEGEPAPEAALDGALTELLDPDTPVTNEEPAPPPPVAPPMTAGDLTVDAERAALSVGPTGIEALFAEGLKLLSRGGTVVLSSTTPVLVLGALGASPSFTVEADEAPTLTLALGTPPTKVLVDGVEQPVVYANGVLTVSLPRGRHTVEVFGE
jgi:hypothetical protein